MTHAQVQALRDAVAAWLERRGHGNREFLRQIRAGEQDDCPFMAGAVVGWRIGAGAGVSGIEGN
jgi:hypothetical protein